MNSPRTTPDTSSAESIIRLLSAHREALQSASRTYNLPHRDLDEFSAKLQQKHKTNSTSDGSVSCDSCTTFEPQPIYTIDEVTENSQLSVQKSQLITSSAEELKERMERMKRISATAKNSKRPESRRGTNTKAHISQIAARVNYHEEIVQKFEIIDRFLKDQTELKQDPICSEESSTQNRYNRNKSTAEKNRIVRSLCCICVSGN